jgi:hypothetical protein
MKMAVVKELLRSEVNGAISFGNHKLAQKAKLENFEHKGDVYKVKTFGTMTKLEKNSMFLYESVPGTSVINFEETDRGVSFFVEGDNDAQITLGMEDGARYEVFINDKSVGVIDTDMGGKLTISVELAGNGEVSVKAEKR